MATEAEIQAAILLRCGRGDVRLFRNTVGTGWMGEVVERRGDLTILRNARFTTFGLCPGSGDLIGWKSEAITADMVGKTIARFVSLEVKGARGIVAPTQTNWLQRVTAAGGTGGVVRTPAEALFLLNGDNNNGSVDPK